MRIYLWESKVGASSWENQIPSVVRIIAKFYRMLFAESNKYKQKQVLYLEIATVRSIANESNKTN